MRRATLVEVDSHRNIGLRLISLLLGWSMDAFRASGVSYAGIDVPEHDYLYSTYVDYGFEVTARTRVYVSNLDG